MPREENNEGAQSEGTYQPDQTNYSRVFNSSKNLGALREIPVFEPDAEGGVNVNDFLEAVDNAAFLGNLDNNDVMRVMPMRLRGAAKGYYRTYLVSKRVNPENMGLGALWPDFKRGLKDRFGKATDSVANLMQLTRCQQADTESARSYAQRVKTLAYKTWPTFTQSQDESTRLMGESLIYQHFLKGLKPDNIERIHLKGIKDLDAAVLELTNKETFDSLQRTGDRTARVNLVGEGMPTDAEQLRGEMRELKDTISAHITETAELLRAHAYVTQSAPKSYSGAGMQPPMSEDTRRSRGMAMIGSPGAQVAPPCADDANGQGRWGYATRSEPQLSYPGAPGIGEPMWEGYEHPVYAVEYQPRLPQYPILRPAAPRGVVTMSSRPNGQLRAAVACFNCHGPHYVRYCPNRARFAAPGNFGGGRGIAGPLRGRYVLSGTQQGMGADQARAVRMPRPQEPPRREADAHPSALN